MDDVSIDRRIADTGGRSTGFDYLRIGLATSIVAWHTIIVCYGHQAQVDALTGLGRSFWIAILPMFFALSGFLVSGSLERCRSLVSFLGLRVIRLGPALAVESALAVLVLGPVFTTLPLGEYFGSPQTWSYLQNIVGDIHYRLPGVFEKTPALLVNAQLWTLPSELKCYMWIAILSLVGAYRWKFLLLVAVAMLQVVLFRSLLITTGMGHNAGILNSAALILAFLYGVTIYRFRASLPYSPVLFAISIALMVGLLGFEATKALAMAPAAYATVYLGLLNPPRNSLISRGDYSYGIFLYGFPIQQAVAAALPWSHHWWLNFAIAFPLVVAFAVASWHLIEKPSLKLRSTVKAIEAAWLPYGSGINELTRRTFHRGLHSRWSRAVGFAPR